VTGAQCREARSLLSWSRPTLSAATDISPATIGRFERLGRMPQPQKQAVQVERILVLRAALEAAGIDFIQTNGGKASVRLAKPTMVK
jgi:ribosome-binding protein aMBF1 (putative translation factor)